MVMGLLYKIFLNIGKTKIVTELRQLRRITVLIVGILFVGEVSGQALSQYTFSATNGSYSAINTTALTRSGGNADDGYYNNIAIGFIFTYCGIDYTTISASTNGWLTFGQNITNAEITNNLTSGGVRPLLAPLWDDLAINGDFRVSTTGTSPNRVFTAQWRRMLWDYNASGRVISFQVKLYETTNVLSFIYFQENRTPNNASASIGITNSSSGSGSFWSLNGTGTNPTVSSTTETTNLNARPANGQTYTFTPPTSVTYYSSGNTPADDLNNWWTNTNGTGSHPIDFTSGDIFIVQSGHNMTTTGTWSVNGSGSMVQISNNASITETQNITLSVNTTLQIDDGGTLNHNVNSISVFGGTEILGATSTVNYGYAGAQALVGLDYGNLTISGGGTKTLQGSATVNNILNLSNGNLSLGSGANNLTIGVSGSIAGTFDNSHMIVCDGTGSLIRQGDADADFNMVYPLGTGTYYSPLQISNFTASDNTGDISIRAVSGSAPGPPSVNSTDLQKYWEINQNGLTITNADLSFTYNSGEVGIGGDQSSYMLNLYSGGAWSLPIGVSGGGVNPMTITGRTNIAGTWTGREAPITYYSYQSGDWATALNWTTDPSGTMSVNPAVPGTGDRVVILNGRTITTSASRTVLSVQINEGGILDIGTTNANTFGEVRGKGLLRLNSNTFPTGTFDEFVSASGGTVEYYNLNNTRISNTQLTYNNLIISNYTTNNYTVYLDNATNNITYTINGNFDLKNNSSGTLTFNYGNPTASNNLINMTVYGNYTVSSGSNIRVNNFAGSHTLPDPNSGAAIPTYADVPVHTLFIYGNLTNNGSVRFTGWTTPQYTATTTAIGTAYYGHVQVYFRGNSNNTVTCNGITDFFRFVVEKGSDQTYILDVNSANTANFSLYGPNNQGRNMNTGGPEGFGYGTYFKALFIHYGTLKLNENIDIPTLTEGGQDLNIIPTAQLWINGATISTTINSGVPYYKATTVYGKLRISSGSLTTAHSTGLVLGTLGTPELLIEGGSLSLCQFWSITGTNIVSYIQTGGTVDIRMQGQSQTTAAMFNLSNTNSVFRMSGGVINFTDNQYVAGYNGSYFYSLMDIQAQTGNYLVTGGTINFDLPGSGTSYTANSTVPLYNLNISRRTGTNPVTIQWNTPTSNLKVLNDLNVGTNTELNLSAVDLYVGRNFTLTGTYRAGNNTTNFNGLGGQVFTNAGTINPGSGLFDLVISNQSNTSITNPLTIRRNLTINSSCFLNDQGNSIYVSGDISNSGTHTSQAGGGLIVTGTIDQAIGGSGSGIFGNLIINKTGGLASFSANQSVAGNLRLVNGLLDINIYKLSLGTGSNVYDALTGTTAVFSGTKMIRTTGSMSDGGVSKTYNSTSAFVFPVGTASDYTPATIQFNSAPTTWGSVNIKPIAEYNPFVTSTNSLNYYWKVRETGFVGIPANSVSHTYRYVDSDLVGRGTEGNYIPGVYNPFAWVYINDISQVVDASNDIRFNNVSYVDGDYTAGELAAFNTVRVFYSRTNGLWTDPNTWSTVAVGGVACPAGSVAGVNYPGPSNPVVIGDGASFNHVVTVGVNNVTVGGLQINSGSTLDIGTTTGHDFGSIPDSKITGSGLLRISSSATTATFPGGDFGNFLTSGGGTVEYYSSGVNFTLPTTKLYYNHLAISPAGGEMITMPDIDLTIYGNYTVSGAGTGIAQLNAVSPRTLDIKGDMSITGGTLQFSNGSTQAIYTNNVTIANGTSFRVINAGNKVSNLYISGNFANEGTFNMYVSATRACDVYFTGDQDKIISGSGSNTFNYLHVDKGTSRNTLLNVEADNMNLLGAGTALVLENGTFRVSNTNLNFTLSTTSPFTIPATAALSANEGTVNIGTNSNTGDLALAGRLELMNTGVVNIGNGSGTNNDIEYAAAGNPEIIVLGGTLTVDGQIRRLIDNTLGSLTYTQSGGNVLIKGLSTQNVRGKFEVLNSGSQFNMSGGTLTIQNGDGSAGTYGDVHITPEFSNVSNGTIQFGNSNTDAARTGFLLNSSAPLGNVTIDQDKTVDLRINPLVIKHNLEINTGAVFNANGINVNIGGNLINYNSDAGTNYVSSGGYRPGTITQITTFDGSGTQYITGSGSNLTNFADLVITPTDSVTLSSNSNVRINGNLTINTGVLNDGSNNITVIGDVDNSAIHRSPVASGGIIFSGTQNQTISGSGAGEFGNITLLNSLGIDMVDNAIVNGQLTFSNGNLYIDDYMLTLGTNATISGTPDKNNMILLNGVISDQGVKKLYPGTAADFTFPIGVAGKYTPVRYNVTANSAPGTILVRPIGYKHPSTYESPAATNELQYYWNVVSTGFSGLTLNQEYNYINGDALPDESNYVVGRYTTATYSWSTPVEGVVNAASDNFVLNNVNFIDGEYTCGVNILPSPNFQDIPVYYSRNSATNITTTGANWTNPNSWTLNADGSGGPAPSYPQGNPTVVLAGHTIILDANSQVAYATEIHGTLNVGTTLYHSLGHIRGDGTIRITSTTSGSFILPAGEYDDFMNNAASTIDFYNNSGTAATLPLKPGNDYKPFQNVIFSGNGVKYMSAENMRILGNLTIEAGTGTLSNTLYNKNLTILGNWTDNNTSATGGFVPGSGNVIFNGTSAQQLSIAGAASTEQFYNLQINNASGMTISGSGKATISNNLYLTLGNITTSNTNLLSITNTSTSAVVGGSSSSFINGPLQKSISSGSYFNYPIGNNNGTKYGNLYVSDISASGNYIAQYYNHNPGTDGYNPSSLVAPLDAVSNVEYWRVNGPAATANVQVRWDAQSGIIPADASSRTKLRIAEWNGTAWQNIGNVIVDGGQTSGTIQTNPVVSVSGNHYFTIGVESLPTVDITSSDASFCNDGIANATITIALTGTAPWTIKYMVNGANETTISNIASSPFNIVIGSTSPGITGAGNYVYNMSYISDKTGATGIRDFTKTVTIQVKDAPNPVITGLTTLPLNTNTDYAVTNVVGNTYSWAIATNGTINSGGSANQANVRFTSGASGWVSVTETMPNGCFVTTPNYNITLTDVPSPLVSGNASVCVNGTTETYSTPNVPGHTYSWSLSSGGSFVGVTNTASVQVNWTTTGTHTISVSEVGSSTVTNDLSVTVNPQPSIVLAVSDPTICLGQTANVIVTAGEAGSDYSLRLNSDNSVITTVHTTAAGDVTLPVTPYSTGNIIYNVYVTNEYLCSQQLTDLSTVTVNPLPVTGPVYRKPNE